MSALSLLARVIRTTDRGEERELLAYCHAHADDIGEAFEMLPQQYLEMLDSQILAALPARLTLEMSNARKGRKDARVAAMQAAADACAATMVLGAVDLSALLPAIVAGGPAWLVIGEPVDCLAAPLEMLRRFHAARRSIPAGWSARIEPQRISIRWLRKGRSGGLNIPIRPIGHHQLRTEGAIYLNRPSRDLSAAAE